MRKLSKFFDLSTRDKLWFVQIFLVLTPVLLLLRILPFRYFTKAYKASLLLPQFGSNHIHTKKLSALTKKAAGSFPFTVNCLPIALTYKWFLRNNKQSKLCIGVQQNPEFEFHAWVEKEGIVLINETKDDSFSLLWQII